MEQMIKSSFNMIKQNKSQRKELNAWNENKTQTKNKTVIKYVGENISEYLNFMRKIF